MQNIYSEQSFNKNVAHLLSREIFTNGNVAEIIKYLETDYNNYQLYTYENFDKINEEILLALKNKLVNNYLIKFCKSKETFFSLLKSDQTLLTQAIFNKNIWSFGTNTLILYLLDNIEVLETFLNFQLESKSMILVNDLINKKNVFASINEDVYFDVLKTIFAHHNIENILKDESEEYSYDPLKDRLCYSIWNLLENLTVNATSISLLASIGAYNRKYMRIHYNGSKYTVNDMFIKWANFKYNKVERAAPFDFVTSNADELDEIYIQMLIASYSSINFLKSKYDGARAHFYMYGHIEQFLPYYDDKDKDKDKEEFENFINKQRKDKMFEYFKFNFWNYTEDFFDISYRKLELEGRLILKNFEQIGKSITILDWWDLNNILEDNRLSKDENRYYKTLFYFQKNELDISFVGKIINDNNTIRESIDNKKFTLF